MSFLKQLLSDKPVAYYPSIARILGSPGAAVFLQQIAHWQGTHENQWVFRTQEQFENETALTPDMQNTARKLLKRLDVLEEKHDGMPRRLYYRLKWSNVEALLEAGTRPGRNPEHVLGITQNKPQVEPGTSSRCHQDLRNESMNRVDESNNPTGSGASPEKAVDLNKYWLNLFYKAMQDTHGISLEASQYRFHLGHFGRALEKGASDKEMQQVVSHMIEKLPSSPKIHAVTALQDVRMGRHDGSAWAGPAPWEKAKGRNEKTIEDYEREAL